MERIPVNEPNQSLLYNSLTSLIHSLGYESDLQQCTTLSQVIELAQNVSSIRYGSRTSEAVVKATENLSVEDANKLECRLETPTRRYIFAGQQNLNICLANGGGESSLIKYANVVFNKATKQFIKHRGISHQAANLILKQAGY